MNLLQLPVKPHKESHKNVKRVYNSEIAKAQLINGSLQILDQNWHATKLPSEEV